MEKPLVHVFIDQENCLLSEMYVRTTLARLRADVKLYSFFGAAKAKSSMAQYFEGFDFVHKGLPLGQKKNALDFVMAIEAGRIMESERAKGIETRILFFSKDADFDSVAAHLRSCGATAHRTVAQTERVETLAERLGVGCDDLPDEFVTKKNGSEVCSYGDALDASMRRLRDIVCIELDSIDEDAARQIQKELVRVGGVFRQARTPKPKTLVALLRFLHTHLLKFRHKHGRSVFSAVVCLALIWMRAVGVVWFKDEKKISGAIKDTLGGQISDEKLVWPV